MASAVRITRITLLILVYLVFIVIWWWFCWLQAAFDDIALFFYDIYGGNYIGVLWKPIAAETENQLKVW